VLSIYARDVVFFFKLYLFLRAYLHIRKIKIITCELRLTETHTPLLYLVINTITRRKRKRRKHYRYIRHYIKHVSKSMVKQSPFQNPLNKKILPLLF
jgi:hypothetical protein